MILKRHSQSTLVSVLTVADKAIDSVALGGVFVRGQVVVIIAFWFEHQRIE
jgi:hypothetical protein